MKPTLEWRIGGITKYFYIDDELKGMVIPATSWTGRFGDNPISMIFKAYKDTALLGDYDTIELACLAVEKEYQ